MTLLFWPETISLSVSIYRIAIRYCAGSPPVPLIAAVMRSMACASASATLSRAAASASACRIFACLSPSAVLISDCRMPSAARIRDCRSASAVMIVARRSRSARICFSMASRISRGGLMSLSSTRLTLEPHLCVASSRIARSLALIVSREDIHGLAQVDALGAEAARVAVARRRDDRLVPVNRAGAVDQGQDEVDARAERLVVLAEPLDDHRLRLLDHADALRDQHDHAEGDRGHEYCARTHRYGSFSTMRVVPST